MSVRRLKKVRGNTNVGSEGLIVRVLDGGEPAGNTPVELMFDGSHRVERWSDEYGEIRVEPCRGSEVLVMVNGIAQGTFTCRDGLELNVELR